MKDLNSALVSATIDILPYPVKYEGKLFEIKDPNQPWLEIKHIPVDNNPLQTVEKVTGILQIDINHPLDSGAPVLHSDADAVRAVFKPYAYFKYGNQSFTVKKTSASQIMQKGNYNVIHLSIYYFTTVSL